MVNIMKIKPRVYCVGIIILTIIVAMYIYIEITRPYPAWRYIYSKANSLIPPENMSRKEWVRIKKKLNDKLEQHEIIYAGELKGNKLMVWTLKEYQGPLAAKGTVYIFEMENGEWQLCKTFEWVS